MDDDSIFKFVGMEMPPASARGVSCPYRPVAGGKRVAMLSGEDRKATRGVKKFQYTASGSDLWVPPFVGLWIGEDVVAHLPCLFVESVTRPQQRPAVPGTLVYLDADMSEVPQEQAVWRAYNPIARVHVLDWEIDPDEWGAVASWTVSLREVQNGGA